MSNYDITRPSQGYLLDHRQGRHRIGLLALNNDRVVERDMMSMRPSDDDVHLFVARVPYQGDCAPAALSAMAGELTSVTDTILPGDQLDAVIYSCTSGTATIGPDKVAAAIHASQPGAAVVTPISAAQAAFSALELKRISVVTPYTDDVTATTVMALKSSGVDVVRVIGLGIAAPSNISAVRPESILEAAIEADDTQADGIFISCTDFRAAQIIEEIESAVAMPVVTANQATFWQATRMVGYTKPITGFGKLMRL